MAAILNKDPEEIAETTLMPTILSKDTEDGKYGILDVRVRMKNGSQMDLEITYINEVYEVLQKLSTDERNDGGNRHSDKSNSG